MDRWSCARADREHSDRTRRANRGRFYCGSVGFDVVPGARTFQSAATSNGRSAKELSGALEHSGLAADWKVRSPGLLDGSSFLRISNFKLSTLHSTTKTACRNFVKP